jgi:hypothetical protein
VVRWVYAKNGGSWGGASDGRRMMKLRLRVGTREGGQGHLEKAEAEELRRETESESIKTSPAFRQQSASSAIQRIHLRPHRQSYGQIIFMRRQVAAARPRSFKLTVGGLPLLRAWPAWSGETLRTCWKFRLGCNQVLGFVIVLFVETPNTNRNLSRPDYYVSTRTEERKDASQEEQRYED